MRESRSVGVSTGREVVTNEIPGSLTIYTMYIINSKGLEVNETHFQFPEIGGYTRHIQDYKYFEYDFYTYKRESESSDNHQIWSCYFALCLCMRLRGRKAF